MVTPTTSRPLRNAKITVKLRVSRREFVRPAPHFVCVKCGVGVYIFGWRAEGRGFDSSRWFFLFFFLFWWCEMGFYVVRGLFRGFFKHFYSQKLEIFAQNLLKTVKNRQKYRKIAKITFYFIFFPIFHKKSSFFLNFLISAPFYKNSEYFFWKNWPILPQPTSWEARRRALHPSLTTDTYTASTMFPWVFDPV